MNTNSKSKNIKRECVHFACTKFLYKKNVAR